MKHVGIAELKAKLSENLGAVRRGESITVLDRRTPVALIVPFRTGSGTLQVRHAAGRRRLGRIPLPSRAAAGRDIVELLLEDRAAR